MTWSIGIDTGGTFTDVIALDHDSQEVWTHKLPSTPHDPSEAVLGGIDAFLHRAGGRPNSIEHFVHGTTVATNAIIEGKGAKAGLLTTMNMGAVLTARMSSHPEEAEALDPNFSKPAVLISPRLTGEINERVLFDGSVQLAPKDEEILRVVDTLVQQRGIESLAICFLFSFMNPAHEERARALIAKRYPELRISTSNEVAPIIREYPRFSTTAIDAYVGPKMQAYFLRLEAGLAERGVDPAKAFIMQSHGGLMSLKVAGANPAHTLLSGPAAGVIAGQYLSGLCNAPHLVTFDVGGTSTDIAIINKGEVAEVSLGLVAGYHAAVPMTDIQTIGAGGGTIAKVGVDGRLSVGPQSAGAHPGPACFCRGGQHATVTDAAMVLGYLGTGSFLGGGFKVDPSQAHEVIRRTVAEPLAMSTERAALGIYRLATSLMESELRLSLMSHGFDPRQFSLVALGGAGPLHAACVARNVRMKGVLVPLHPGIGSATGLLQTDVRHQFSRARLRHLDDFSLAEINAVLSELEDQAVAQAHAERGHAKDLRLSHSLDLRYPGQGYELNVHLIHSPVDAVALRAAVSWFHELHLLNYGHNAPDNMPEVVNLRLVSSYVMPKLAIPQRKAGTRQAPEDALKSRRNALFDGAIDYVSTPVYDRAKLRPQNVVDGPAIIEQNDSTIVVLPGQLAEIDSFGHVAIYEENDHE